MTTRRPGFTAAAALSFNSVGAVNPGAHRYWRIVAPSTQVGGTGGDDNFAVAEIAMRSFLNGSDIAGGLTYASSSDTGAANDAAKAFDDNTTTYLDTTDATDAWVSVDFGVSNDSEVHEIAFTNVASATRKAPASLRVEYSDDNSMWFIAWLIFPDAWTDTQETRIFSAPYGQSQYPTTDWRSISTGVAGAWGTVLRNHGYTGPALRVEDNSNPGTVLDINFDSAGLVRGDTPYGSDTRVVALYDQFGSSDLFAVRTDNITIEREDNEVGVWRLNFNGGGELTSTILTDSSPPWASNNPVWAVSCERETLSGFYTLWGIPTNSNSMELGAFVNNTGIQWRVNASSSVTWVGADYVANSDVVHAPGVERLIGDVSDGVEAHAVYNGNDAGTLAFTGPLTYDAGEALNIGGGVSGQDFRGNVVELVIFDPAGPITPAQTTAIDDALKEAHFFVTGSEVISQEQRAYVILGASEGVIGGKAQRLFAVLGARPDQLFARRQALYAILGNYPDHTSASDQRLYTIIVP